MLRRAAPRGASGARGRARDRRGAGRGARRGRHGVAVAVRGARARSGRGRGCCDRRRCTPRSTSRAKPHDIGSERAIPRRAAAVEAAADRAHRGARPARDRRPARRRRRARRARAGVPRRRAGRSPRRPCRWRSSAWASSAAASSTTRATSTCCSCTTATSEEAEHAARAVLRDDDRAERRRHRVPHRRRPAARRPGGRARAGRSTRTTAYWERWAQTWEFQALIKARPVAGDAALGAAFVARARAVRVARRPRPRRGARGRAR